MSRGLWIGSDWQPTGCMLRPIGEVEVAKCFPNGGRIAIVGDSRSRQLFHALVLRLNPNASPLPNTTYDHGTLRIEYHRETAVWNSTVKLLYDDWSTSLQPPNIVIHNAGLWALKAEGENGVTTFGNDLRWLASMMERVASRSYVVWRYSGALVESKLWEARRRMTNALVQRINEEAESILGEMAPHVHRLESSYSMYAGVPHLSEDGVHYAPSVYNAESDLILNAYCNRERSTPLTWSGCCAHRPAMTPVQTTFIGVSAFVAAMYVVMACSTSQRRTDLDVEAAAHEHATTAATATGFLSSDATRQFIWGCAKMFCVLSYYFVADRTNYFMRSSKHFQGPWWDFYVPFLVIIGVGYAVERANAQRPGFLNREQTEEWKGWMQVVLLLYHAVGASKAMSIYSLARMIVASYLFLSGYGHFSYFYLKNDFSMSRVMQVLLRLNVLVAFMSLTMNLDYQAYYFVPLSTFWFLVVYVVMRVGHDSNRTVAWVVPVKLAGMFAFGAILWYRAADGSMPIADAVFGKWPLRVLFEDHGSTTEWKFRSALDRFVVPVGMLTAYVYIVWVPRLERLAPSTATVMSVAASVAGFFGIFLYFAVSATCLSKQECNAWHPYTSIGAVLGFAWLRNASPQLRTLFSPVFVYFGGISLELFLGQYHILLASDTKGLLVLVPGHPYINALVVSAVFVVASDIASKATGEIVTALFAANKRTLTMGAVVLIALASMLRVLNGVLLPQF
eukprot:Opistho-2@69411